MSCSSQTEMLGLESVDVSSNQNRGHSSSVASEVTFGVGNVTLKNGQGSISQAFDLAKQLEITPAEPLNFIQHLAKQNQLLACLKWLSQFQVLACIPLHGDISTAEIAELVDAPENHLIRIARFTATAGFLREPQPGRLAHTGSSSPFVTTFSFLDAVIFLTETAVPTALQMPAIARCQSQLDATSSSAYSIAFNTSSSFRAACEEQTRLHRQWSAYRQCAGDVEDSMAELFAQLDWNGPGDACVVDVRAESVEAFVSLAERCNTLRFVVQLDEVSYSQQRDRVGNLESRYPHVKVQTRLCGARQQVRDASVYILHPRPPSILSPAQIRSELEAHLEVLAGNLQATLVLAPALLPEPGSVEPKIEAIARMGDLSNLQLANSPGLEVREAVEVVRSVRDSAGHLTVFNKIFSRRGLPLALAVRYEAFPPSR